MERAKNLFGWATLLCAVALLTITTSCREEEKKEETVTQTQSQPEMSNTEKWQQLQQTGTQNTTTTPANGDIAKNPAHGQPGHRCDIPVGAPLNSTPAQNTTTTPLNTSNSEGVTLNPPHGQPGHRCDIKVGDPLI